MKLKAFVIAWLVFTSFLAVEFLALHGFVQRPSTLAWLVCRTFDECGPLWTDPGKPLSYWLGWMGFGAMVLMNVYMLRKRVIAMRTWGRLETWLNWHIFCGMMGPTLIVFHTDFRVNGLVAISFWSMVISALSGVAGRFFYLQVLGKNEDLKKVIAVYESEFEIYAAKRPGVGRLKMKAALEQAYAMAGGLREQELKVSSPLKIIWRSFVGEVTMQFFLPRTSWGASRPTRRKLREWALLRKRLLSLEVMKRLFGYWKTFHTPFAVFMYGVAVVHIISSHIFKVS